MNEPVGSAGPAPQRNNTPIIIGVVAVLLLCCCCVAIGGWLYGDQILQQLGIQL